MSDEVVCAILGAGRGSRFGRWKSTLALGSRSFLEHAFAATAGYRSVIVLDSEDLAAQREAQRLGVDIVTNHDVERGMSYSLRLADRALEKRAAALAVLLVDTPLVDGALLERIVAARGACDIAYPRSEQGRPGHPVVFGPRARAAIDALRDGDTIRTLRDDARFSRATLVLRDGRAFCDVDTPSELETLRAFFDCAPATPTLRSE